MRLASLLLLVVLATGCASTPLKHFPAFPEEYAAADSTRLLVSITLLEDRAGGTDYLALSTNQTLGESLAETLTSAMTERGYRVDRTYEPAVGLYFDPDLPVRVQLTREAPDSLEMAPFLIPEAVYQDPDFLSAIDAAISRAPLDDVTVEEAEPEGAPEAYVVLSATGRRVPLEKSCVQGVTTGLLTTLLTGGLVTGYAYETSFAAVSLDIVDATTGTIIWHDEAAANSDASDATLRGLVRKLARRMPERSALSARARRHEEGRGVGVP